MKKISKELHTVEIMNYVSWYTKLLESNNADKLKILPVNIRWALKKTIDSISKSAQLFEEFKNEILTEFQKEFFSDEKSIAVKVPQTDKNGNTILDEHGNPIEMDGRQIKKEYLEQYKEKEKEINKQLREALSEKNEYKIFVVNLDDFVESLNEDSPFEFSDLEMLSLIDDTCDD